MSLPVYYIRSQQDKRSIDWRGFSRYRLGMHIDHDSIVLEKERDVELQIIVPLLQGNKPLSAQRPMSG